MPMAIPNFLKKRNGKSGYIVSYKDAKGRTYEARVISAGTGSGLKLRLNRGFKLSTSVVDNVPLATSLHQSGVYFNRYPPA